MLIPNTAHSSSGAEVLQALQLRIRKIWIFNHPPCPSFPWAPSPTQGVVVWVPVSAGWEWGPAKPFPHGYIYFPALFFHPCIGCSAPAGPALWQGIFIYLSPTWQIFFQRGLVSNSLPLGRRKGPLFTSGPFRASSGMLWALWLGESI